MMQDRDGPRKREGTSCRGEQAAEKSVQRQEGSVSAAYKICATSWERYERIPGLCRLLRAGTG